MPSTSRLANPDDIDITVIWHAVIRNLKRLLLSALALGVIVYLLLSSMHPRYQSEAQILIENEQAGFKQPTGSQSGTGGGPIDNATVRSQAQILKSTDLARQVVEKLKLNTVAEFNSAVGRNTFPGRIKSVLGLGGGGRLPESERVLEAYFEKLVIYPIKESHVITVEFRSEDAQLAADIANELSKTYIEFLQSSRLDQNKGAQKWLGAEIQQLRSDVEASELKLAQLRSRSGLIPGQNNVTLNVQQLGEINSRLSLAKAQKSEAVARAKLIRKMLNEGTISSAPDVLKSRLIQRLLEQRIRVQRQIAELSATLLGGHPRMAQLRSELGGLRRQIRSESFKLVKGLENEALIAGAKEASLRSSIDSVQKSTVSQSVAQAKIRVLEREVKSKRELYESYVTRLGDASARQSRLSVPVMARISQKATASSIPVFPRKNSIAFLTAIASLFLGLVWIVTRELLVNARSQGSQSGPVAPAVSTPPNTQPHYVQEDARSVAHPVVENKRDEGAIGVVASRILDRAKIQNAHGYRTLMAPEGDLIDGGAQAIELAHALGEAGKSVVLIDWQRGSKSLSAGLGIEADTGLYDLVEGRAGFNDIVHAVDSSSLHVIPQGQIKAKLDKKTIKTQLELVLDALDETYDHILAYGGYESAKELFKMSEGRFDAGVTIGATGRPAVTGGEDNSFLGFLVEGIDVQHYVPGKAGQPSSSLTPGAAS